VRASFTQVVNSGNVLFVFNAHALDPFGEFSFSDATNPDQQVLFAEAPTDGLASELASHFAGKPKMQVVSVEGYVYDDTAYLRRHMVDALKILEGQGVIAVDAIKADGKKRLARTYPNSALIRFTGAIS
jgi:hypothetical protein